jgi:hypothetical protein
MTSSEGTESLSVGYRVELFLTLNQRGSISARKSQH